MAVVGCGGTGGFVAEGLCRLLPKKTDILLIDFDRVEEHNLGRQHFYPGDLGKFKSEALAERLARNFEREIAYSVFPFNPMMGEDWGDGMRSLEISDALVIGCVDNAMARRAIAGDMPGMLGWWIDAGNGYHSGQVLIGNSGDRSGLQGAFDIKHKKVKALPSPAVQLPALLAPAPEVKRRLDCAQAIAEDGQSPVINQMMATLVLDFVHKLTTGRLQWMGVYVDLESGSMSPVPATPEAVAKLTSMKAAELVKGGK